MSRISTADCQLFLTSHYGNSYIDTKLEDWILDKKYKNFHGYTCRDFHHRTLPHKAIVVDVSSGIFSLDVIENQDYTFFLKEIYKKPSLYYIPIIYNDEEMYLFEKSVLFDAKKILSPYSNSLEKFLQRNLKLFLKDPQFKIQEDSTIVHFLNFNHKEIIALLENNNISYNESLKEFLPNNISFNENLNIDEIIKNLEFSDNMSMERIKDKLFQIIAQEEDIKPKYYITIRKLIRAMDIETLSEIQNYVENFRSGDSDLLEILSNEFYNKEKLLASNE